MLDVLAEITDILRTVLRDADLEPTPRTRFDEIAGWDSMDLITIVVEVECRFNVQCDLPDIDKLVTVGDLIGLVAVKRTLNVA